MSCVWGFPPHQAILYDTKWMLHNSILTLTKVKVSTDPTVPQDCAPPQMAVTTLLTTSV